MKHLLFCLLIGSFVFPAWSQEKEMTLDEFIDKVGRIQPRTLEKLKAELDIKFKQTSLSEIYSRHTAYGKPPSAKNLPIDYISFTILRATNRAHDLAIYIDTDSVCLRREHIEAMYPKGFLDVSHAQPEGGRTILMDGHGAWRYLVLPGTPKEENAWRVFRSMKTGKSKNTMKIS